jgi:hypothetical protein
VNGAAGEGLEAEEKFTDPIKLTIPQNFHLPECCHKLMQDLVQMIYVHGDERSKARAVLTHIYHKCIHDDFHSARDALLMSHLQARFYPPLSPPLKPRGKKDMFGCCKCKCLGPV